MLDDVDVAPSEAPTEPRSSSHAASRNKAKAEKSKRAPDLVPGKMSKTNERRKKRRVAQKVEHGHRPSAAAFKKYAQGSRTVFVGLDSVDLPATAGGYGARNAPKTDDDRDVHSKDKLVDERGFTSLEWNGMCVEIHFRQCAAFQAT